MKMLIRITKKSEPVEITSREFEDLVKKGKLTSESLVKNKSIADGKWVSADNIENFHRCSPIWYPPGPHLVEKRKIKEKRRNQWVKSLRLEQYYDSGEMIEKYFELTPIKKLYDNSDITMISRLTVMPAFEPEIVITLLFESDFLKVEIIRGSTSVWHTIVAPYSIIPKNGVSFEETNAISFDLSKAYKKSAKLLYRVVPVPFNNPESFLQVAKDATDCYTDTLDGVGYRHEVVSNKIKIDARWSNPSGPEHATQLNIISSYSIISMDVIFGKKRRFYRYFFRQKVAMNVVFRKRIIYRYLFPQKSYRWYKFIGESKNRLHADRSKLA